MKLLIDISNKWLFGLGIVFLLSTITALTLSQRQRQAVLERVGLHRRRNSGATTPPRSFSPTRKDEKIPAKPVVEREPPPPSSATATPDYVEVFPPSRRSVLPTLAETASSHKQNILIGTEPTLETLLKNPLPTTRPYDLDNDVPKYTPTGFSTAEIKAMGDFPSYDILSGVPLPQPYANFNPIKALPRPYRPFRWAYHQTMCKLPILNFQTLLTHL